MRGLRKTMAYALTPSLDGNHGGDLVRDWSDLLQQACHLGNCVAVAFVRPANYEKPFSTLAAIARYALDSEIAVSC
jgi:hypothetical protein